MAAPGRSESPSSGSDSKLSADLKEPDVPPLAAPIDQTKRSLFTQWRKPYLDQDAVATLPSVFDDPDTLEIYRPPPAYENSHRFDPNARWTWREEKKVVRKIDYRIMLWTFVMFFCLDLDRTNNQQANTDNFLDDLGMNTNDFNLGNTIFKVAFLAAELPSQLISKRIGPDVWIPMQMTLFSIVAFCQFWLNGKASFLVCRVLLGLLQGGFIPDVILYLSYFYTTSELPIRLAFFWISNYASHIISAFLATGILKLRGVNGHAGWQYLFLIEGLGTLLAGFLSFFLMPAGPTQTKAWHRPKGWFSEREEVIMVNRVLRDDPSKSDMHNREGLSAKMIFDAAADWRMWPLYMLGLLHMVPVQPPQTYLTLSLRALGFDTTESNLLTIPSVILGLIGLILAACMSEIINSRTLTSVFLQFYTLPLIAALYTFNSETNSWVLYAVTTLICGYPYVHPIQVAWASTNSKSVRTRTVSASLYNISVQLGGIIAANIYRDDDKPLYKRGNRVLLAINVLNIGLYAFTFMFYRTINKRREAKWSSWSRKEQTDYLETTKDEGNQRLDFRFAY